MIGKFKLKHIDLLAGEKIDYLELMKEVDGYVHKGFFKNRKFKASYKRTHQFIEQVKRIDPKKISYSKECPIKKPNNIGEITFVAMAEINSLMSNGGDREIGDLMTELITLACFSENNNVKFDSDSNTYKWFRKRVEQSSAIYMLGLYNWIDKALVETNLFWEKQFLEVHSEDADYEQAGGKRMEAFNLINTVKKLCKDFNVTYEEAWQLPYSLSQTNNLSDATSAHVTGEMSKIKEHKMKQKQKIR